MSLSKINKQDLIESYIQSKEFIQGSESQHWKKLNEPKRDSFFKSIEENISILQSFRSNKTLSKGLDDAVEKKFIPEVFFKLAEQYNAYEILDYLQEKNIGESDHCIEIFNRFFDYHELFLVDYAFKLDKYFFRNFDHSIVCEIGGGYGGLCRMLSNKHSCKYILIDLPEANLISAYYLDQHFKNTNKRILLFSDLNKSTLQREDIADHDFIIIPPNIKFAENLEIDLFINTRSMMEMESKTISNYFDLIHRNISKSGYFLNVNRYIKKTVGEEIMISRYPYDENWNVQISEKAFMQDHIHLLLTKRDFSESKNIIPELNKLEIEAKKYFESNVSVYIRSMFNRMKSLLPSNLKAKIKSLLFSSKPE